MTPGRKFWMTTSARLRQPFHDAAAFVGAEVERDRALAAVEHVEETGESVAAAADVPLDVADEALHLDDGSALIGEQCSGQRPGNDGRQIEDREAGQRPWHGRLTPSASG